MSDWTTSLIAALALALLRAAAGLARATIADRAFKRTLSVSSIGTRSVELHMDRDGWRVIVTMAPASGEGT